MQVLIPTGRRIHDLVVDTRTKINVRPYCLSVERSKRFGVYFIFNSMEQGTPSIRWRRSTLPTILITASSCGSDPASRITSTFGTKRWAHGDVRRLLSSFPDPLLNFFRDVH